MGFPAVILQSIYEPSALNVIVETRLNSFQI
jgi:hypothetical protein